VIRAPIDHVFAYQKDKMGLFIRTIGLARARTKIGLANLVYNMKRLTWLATALRISSAVMTPPGASRCRRARPGHARSRACKRPPTALGFGGYASLLTNPDRLRWR
jgi:hypothetical protein